MNRQYTENCARSPTGKEMRGFDSAVANSLTECETLFTQGGVSGPHVQVFGMTSVTRHTTT